MMLEQQIVNYIHKELPEVQAIYLFGSVSTGSNLPDSDIDIAILPNAKLDPVVCWQLAQNLASQFNRDVDLIDLWQASTVFRWQVITTGKRLYSLNPVVSDHFENNVCSMYLRFNEERRELLEDIQKRGQVL